MATTLTHVSSNRQLRRIVRWVHIIGGSLIATFIYAPWGQAPLLISLMRWVVIPVLILSGMVLWQQAWLTKQWRSASQRHVWLSYRKRVG